MKNLFLLSFLSLILFSCSKESFDDTDKKIEPTITSEIASKFKVDNNLVHFENYDDFIEVVSNSKVSKKYLPYSFKSLNDYYWKIRQDSTINHLEIAERSPVFYIHEDYLMPIVRIGSDLGEFLNINGAYVLGDSIHIINKEFEYILPYVEGQNVEQYDKESGRIHVIKRELKTTERSNLASQNKYVYVYCQGQWNYHNRRRLVTNMSLNGYSNFVEQGVSGEVQKKSGIFGNWLTWRASRMYAQFAMLEKVDDTCSGDFNVRKEFANDIENLSRGGNISYAAVGIMIDNQGRYIINGLTIGCYYYTQHLEFAGLTQATIYDPGNNDCFHGFEMTGTVHYNW